jgi:glycosyltransferase involved in cell wall biosynthesis
MNNKPYKTLSLVIPVYNEEKTLATVLNRILEVDIGIAKELIIINDASTDKTATILKEFAKHPEVKLFANDTNLGKSLTVTRGIALTTGDLVVIHDADMEYDPADLKGFIDIFNTKDVDIVYGNRFGKKNEVKYFHVWLGNIFLSAVSGIITGLRAGMWIRDAHVCYKMVKGDIMREICKSLTSISGFGFDTEITARLSKYKINNKHLKLAQIPVQYTPRTMGEGKKLRPMVDGLKAFWEIIKYNF